MLDGAIRETPQAIRASTFASGAFFLVLMCGFVGFA
jgi:hypothetical protein